MSGKTEIDEDDGKTNDSADTEEILIWPLPLPASTTPLPITVCIVSLFSLPV